jgi:hypothetical protein
MKQILFAALPVTLPVALLVACGGSTSGLEARDATTDSDSGSPDASPDATGDSATSDGGCVTPVLGASCTQNARVCGDVDACCRGYAWDCSGGTWQQLKLGCPCRAQPCGTAFCNPGTDYCVARESGIAGGSTSYFCAPLPEKCANDWTCGCVETALPSGCMARPGGACTEAIPHQPQVTCMGQ